MSEDMDVDKMIDNRPGLERRCACCGRDNHTLQTCKGPLTMEGCLRGCPYCNSVEHSWDACKKKPSTADGQYHFEVELRRGRPPLEMKDDWREKHLDRVKEAGGIVGGAEAGRWPWSKDFANKNRMLLHTYLGHYQGETYVHDDNALNMLVSAGSQYSVENPGPPLPVAFRNPPPEANVYKKSNVFAENLVHRLKRKSRMISDDNDSIDDNESVTTVRKSRSNARQQSRARVLTREEVEDDDQDYRSTSKQRIEAWSKRAMRHSIPRTEEEAEVVEGGASQGIERSVAEWEGQADGRSEFQWQESEAGRSEGAWIGNEDDDDGTSTVVQELRVCYNCNRRGHEVEFCPYDCGRCGESGHKPKACIVACKCCNFPGHRMEKCDLNCPGFLCNNPVRHRAVDCSVCCLCGLRDHHSTDCTWKSCPCGSTVNHFGALCDSSLGPCLKEHCKKPFTCTIHCRVCGSSHTHLAKWREEYGIGNCAAERIPGMDRFKCVEKYCRGTYAWGEACSTCHWRASYCGLSRSDDREYYPQRQR